MIAFFRWSFSPSFSLKKGLLSPKAWASKDVGSLYSLSSTLKIWGIRRSTRAKWLWDDFGGEIVFTPEWARNCHAHCENRQTTIRNINIQLGIRYSSYQLIFDENFRTGDSGFLASWKSFHPVACVTGSVGRCFRMGTCCLSHNGVSYASDPDEKKRWTRVNTYLEPKWPLLCLEKKSTPSKTRMAMENPLCMKTYLLLKMGIVQCHVSFQGCILSSKKPRLKTGLKQADFRVKKVALPGVTKASEVKAPSQTCPAGNGTRGSLGDSWNNRRAFKKCS